MNIKAIIRKSIIYRLGRRAAFNIVTLLPVDSNKVIFDNFGGRGYGDDPKYIAEELRVRCPELKLIWLTSNMDEIFPEGIKKVKYGTVRAAYHWATSKVWIDNIKSSIKVRKKPQQYYIQTWHSTLGFKKNEKDAKNLSEQYIKIAREDAQRTDLMYSDNDFRMDKYRNKYWYEGEVIKCDVPRLAMLFHPPDHLMKKVFDFYNIQDDKKIVLYAPTFRRNENIEIYKFDYQRCLTSLEKKFGGDFVMMIRLHPNEANRKNDLTVYDGVKIIDATNYPDMQELLGVADVLITDYSGCMFDFGFVQKPVFLYTKDFEQYIKNERDLYFALEELPFSLAVNEQELIHNISLFDNSSYNAKLQQFKDGIGFSDNGKGTEVLADIVLDKLRN